MTQKNTSQHARGRTGARKKVQARTLKTQARFLREFAHCGNVLRSAQAASVGRRIVYTWRETEPFKTLYEEAHEDALDQLEEEARRRAVDGVLEPVVSAGKLVCHVRKYSDTLLIALLKGKRPDTFRERTEIMGKNGRALFPAPSTLSDDELKQALKDALEKL